MLFCDLQISTEERLCLLVVMIPEINNPFIIVEAEEDSLQKTLPAEQITWDLLVGGKVDDKVY